MVFATNIKPNELVDEAFLRRIQYKVQAESPTLHQFRDIFKICCLQRQLAYDDGLVEGLLDGFYRPRGIGLRGCHPRDLIEQALSMAEYLGEPRQLTAELLEAACDAYFVDEAEPAPTYA
jgi:SpoVK/Ycf46/Vps4 family AAA+-type ATPase